MKLSSLACSPVAILCAAPRSVYKKMPGLEVFDQKRDMRTFKGGMPVVAHPPCAQWSTLRHLVKPDPESKALALRCLDLVCELGGVLEHPVGSLLWRELGGRPGFLFVADQHWWGFRARKRTGFYIVGVDPKDLPVVPYSLDLPTHTIAGWFFKERRIPGLWDAAAAATVPALAEWLVAVARSSRA